VALIGRDRRFQRVNRRFCEILGYSEAELVGRTGRDLSHPEDVDHMNAQRPRLYAGEGDAVRKKVVTADEALRYAMSLPVTTTVSGIDSMRVLRQNIRIAGNFTAMTAEEMAALRERVAELAADGRYELYKSTAKHEGDVGRKQHGFPTQDEIAA
jgi:PAS domain-containing protein